MKFKYISDYKFNSVFIRTFIALVIFALILIFASNYIVYEQSTTMLKEQTFTANLNMLSKTDDTVDQIFNQIDQTINRLLQNSSVINAMVVPDMYRYARNNEIINDLKNIVLVNEYISSIYVYVPFNDIVYSSNGGVYKLNEFYDKDWITEYSNNPDAFSQFDVRLIHDTAGREYNGITVFKDFPAVFRARLGQVIINIDVDKLYHKIQSSAINLDGEIFVISSQGKVLLHPDKDKIGENLKKYSYTEKILNGGQGNLIDKVNGKDTLLFYTSSSRAGWKYVYSIPMEKLGINTLIVFKIILFTSLACIILSLILSFLITKGIYAPMQKLMSQVSASYNKSKLNCESSETIKNEYDFLGLAYTNVIDRNNNMEAFFDSIKPVVREKLFTSLLNGLKLDEQVIIERLKFLNINFSLNNFVVMAVQINNYTDFSNHYNEIESNLYKIGLINQIEDKVSNGYQYECVCIEVELYKIAVIINFNETVTLVKAKEDTFSIANEIEAKVKESVPFTITLGIGIGRLYKNIWDINSSYKEANNALNYKLYLGKNNVIDIDNMEQQSEELYYYRSEKEKLLINNLKIGKKHDVITIIDQLFQEIEESGNLSYNYIQQIFTRIINLIIELIINSGMNVKDVFGGEYDLYQEFSGKETIQDIKAWLIQVCDRVINSLDEIVLSKKNKYIEKVKEYIEENSKNDMSLNDVAEYIGLNPAYLSKLFKENFGQNFIDFLNLTRIDNAKQLLKNTQLSIKEIGFKVGFNTIQNFMRAFKKYEGITPGQYRGSI